MSEHRWYTWSRTAKEGVILLTEAAAVLLLSTKRRTHRENPLPPPLHSTIPYGSVSISVLEHSPLLLRQSQECGWLSSPLAGGNHAASDSNVKEEITTRKRLPPTAAHKEVVEQDMFRPFKSRFRTAVT